MSRTTAEMTTAQTEMVLESAAGAPVVHAELRYRAHQPFAVELSLRLGNAESVEWSFARELLLQGLHAPAGCGDVQLFPAAGLLPASSAVMIELRSPDGRAVLRADRADLEHFASATLEMVPLGSEREHYNLDLELAALLIVADRASDA
ncbi:SsgA family sporulation/cell division regulator [Nakamurella aerolata]|uniref:SsgA family sporulation/cell division regulator n=1 Tax=Nakamurella aerolata TaxID=1656892 RepID=A0A849AAT8_9ACTN|nr:SsgA family sporulation/cell division regulator [Nakamurella aerolata]NNG37645.1 SsgA family sporulation/cell division regulator [Nakamurella aerolata]